MDRPAATPVSVTMLMTAETQVAPLSGLCEALTAFPLLAEFEPDLPRNPFDVQVAATGPLPTVPATGLRLDANCTLSQVARTEVAIVPLMAVDGPSWEIGCHREAVDWLRSMHDQGAVVASVCTGALLLAETGLLDDRDATIHWAFANTLRRARPAVRVRPEETLIVDGDRDDLVMTGGVTSWHDLALHLVTRYVGPSAALALARMLMLEWHGSGQAPYLEFSPDRDHHDPLVADLQEWLEGHLAIERPVEEMHARAGVSRRTLERRFRAATGLSPIGYVQQLRIREARRLLERTTMPVDEIGFAVGYLNTAYFRSLFRRTNRLGPGAYRRKFGQFRVHRDSNSTPPDR